MVILNAFIGFIVGWIVNGLADYLPRFSAMPPASLDTRVRLRLPWRYDSQDKWALAGEILSAGYFAYLWLHLGLSWDMLFYAGSYIFFLLVALIDLKYRLVLNVMTYPAMAAILLIQIASQRAPLLNILLGGGMAFIIFFATAWLKPGDLGGGDIKLATLIGLMLGFPQVLWALIVGGGIGALVAIILWRGHRESKLTMPYAPFLCLGVMVALLYNPILLTR